MVPEISKKRGAVELVALLGETFSMESYPFKDEGGAFVRGVLKTVQIMACLGSLPPFNSYFKYIPAGVLGGWAVLYVHGVPKNRSNQTTHTICDHAAHALNVVTKVINSFAIAQMVHRFFYQDQKPGALMLTTTAITLGISAVNALYDWEHLSTLRGDPRY